jgi:hypothetical protein
MIEDLAALALSFAPPACAQMPRAASRPPAGEPVGQEMRPGCDIGLEKGAEFGTGMADSTAIRALPAKNPLTPHRLPCFPIYFSAPAPFDGGDNQLLSGLAAPR